MSRLCTLKFGTESMRQPQKHEIEISTWLMTPTKTRPHILAEWTSEILSLMGWEKVWTRPNIIDWTPIQGVGKRLHKCLQLGCANLA